jgi:phage shock protein A
MTEEDRLLLFDLKENMQHLFELCHQFEEEKKMLLEEVEALQNKIESLEHERSELGKKNEQLKVANQLLSQTDENQEAKQKINSLIREIDKCIALLNK